MAKGFLILYLFHVVSFLAGISPLFLAIRSTNTRIYPTSA